MFKLLSKKINIISLLLLVALLCSVTEAATVDVTSYGAVGTGNEADATTNVAAFASAIAAAGDGGTVTVPSGVYYINASIGIDKNDLTLDGYGATI